MKKLVLKSVAGLVLVTFSTSQILWAQAPLEAVAPIEESFKPEKSITASGPNPSPNPEVPVIETSNQFLSDESPLSPAKEERHSSLDYEYERYSFEKALDLFRSEFASAVILEKPFSLEGLEKLKSHSIEKGIEIAGLVLHGETVLISSGSGDEIAASPAMKGLLTKASFVFHTHPDEHSKEGPTGPDLVAAGEKTHYLLTLTQAYAYNQEGVLETGDIDWLTARYLEALNASQAEKDEKEAREDLNTLIAEQDKLNQIPTSEDESTFDPKTWLAGGTISYTSNLTSANVTTLPGSPYPYYLTGSSSGTTLALNADGTFKLGYNVTATGSISGMTVSFDNASTASVETQNLSTLSRIVFGVKGPARQLKVQFVDVNGNKDLFTLKNISSSSERFWKILTSNIVSTVDKTKIKQINLYVDQSTTSSSTRTGSMTIRSYGLNINAPTQPAITSTIPPATNQTTFTLSGTKDANSSILVNGVEVIPLNNSTTWSYAASLFTEGNNTFNISSKNSIGKVSTVQSVTLLRDTLVPTGSVDINSGSSYTNSSAVTLNLSGSDGSGSGVVKMSFSTDNTTWTTPEAYATSKTFTLPSGDGTKTVWIKYYDKAGNTAVFTDTIVLDTTAPEIIFTSAVLTNQVNYVLTYTEDGVAKSRSVTLVEGANSLVVTATDLAGNSATSTHSVTLDTKPPEIIFTSAGLTNQAAYTLTYTVDGIAKTESHTLAQEGMNALVVTATDPAGNTASATYSVTLDITPPEIILTSAVLTNQSNYTLAYTKDGVETSEAVNLLAGENIFHRFFQDEAGNTTKSDFLVYYKENFPVWEGDPNRVITVPARVSAEGASLLSVTLEGGTKVFYENGVIHHLTFPDGTFVQNVTLDSEGKIREAVLFLTDGRILIVQGGVLIQEILPDEKKIDYTSQGLMVKETSLTGDPTFYYYERDTASQITRIWSKTGNLTVAYDSQARLEWVFSGNNVRKFDSGIIKRIVTSQGILTDYTLTESVASDGTKTFNLALANPSPAELIQSAKFDSDRNPLEMSLGDGTKLFFTNGLVTKAIDKAGNETQYDYSSDRGLLLQLGVNKPGVRSEYNLEGKLSKIVTDEAAFEIKDEAIAKLDLKDGSQVTNLAMDSQGNVAGATIKDPDGTLRTYQNNEITQVIRPDGSVWNYLEGKPKELITSLNLKYEFVHEPDQIRADLLNVEIADASSPIQLIYDKNFNLQWMKRKNNEILHFQDVNLQSRTLPDGTQELYTYTKDAEGNIVETLVSHENVKNFFDGQGRIEKTVISPTLENPHTTEVIYRYGKIREVYEDSVKTMNYTYEFDASGNEITVIENLKTNTLTHYQGKLLLTSLDRNTNVLTTNTYEGEKLKHAEKSRNGKILETFDYEYAGTEIKVKDKEGVIRVYDGTTQKLIREHAQGATYEYAYTKHAFLSETNPFVKENVPSFSLSNYQSPRILGHDGLYLYVESTNPSTGVRELHRVGPSFDFLGPSGQIEAMDSIIKKPDGALVTVPQGVKGVAHSDQSLYFVGSTPGSIQQLDLRTGELNSISLSFDTVLPAVDRIEILSDGLLLYIARFFGNEIYVDVIDTRLDFKTVQSKRFETPFTVELVATDGTYFYAVEKLEAGQTSHKAHAFRMKEGDLVRTWDIPSSWEPEQIFYDAIHNELWVKGKAETSLYRLSGMRDLTGKETSTRELTLMEKEDGTKVKYSKGKIVEITKPDGVRVTDFVAEQDGAIVFARYHYPDGTIEEVQGHISIEIPQPDFSTKTFTKGKLTKWTFVDGKEIVYTYEDRADGEYTLTKTGPWTYVYNPSGALTEVKRGFGKPYDKEKTYQVIQEVVNGATQIVFSALDEKLIFDNRFELKEYHSLVSGAKVFFNQGEVIRIEEPTLQADFDLGEATWIKDFLGHEIKDLVYDQDVNTQEVFRTLEAWQATGLQRREESGVTKSDLVDLNGDGFLDRVFFYETDPNWKVQFGNGSGFSVASDWTGIQTVTELSTQGRALRYKSGASTYVDLIDINGDGRADRIVSHPSWNGYWKVQLNNGSGFDPIVNWTGVTNFSQQTYQGMIRNEESAYSQTGVTADLIDLNGDGRPDRVEADPDGFPGTWKVSFNNGTGFGPSINWGPVDNIQRVKGAVDRILGWSIHLTQNASADWPVNGVNTTLIDVNGDGLPDRVQTMGRGETSNQFESLGVYRVQINNGRGFDAPINWGESEMMVPAALSNSQSYYLIDHTTNNRRAVDFIDMNGDGLPDRVQAHPDPQYGGTKWMVQYNHGDGLKEMTSWGGIERAWDTNDAKAYLAWDGATGQTHLNLIDINGDGLPDRVFSDPNQANWQVQLNGNFPYLIQSGLLKRGSGNYEDAVASSSNLSRTKSLLIEATGRYAHYMQTLLPYVALIGGLGAQIKEDDLLLTPDKVNQRSQLTAKEGEIVTPWIVKSLIDGRKLYYEGEELVGMRDAQGRYTEARQETNSNGQKEIILSDDAGERRYSAGGKLIEIVLPSGEKLKAEEGKLIGRNGVYTVSTDGFITSYTPNHTTWPETYRYENGILKELVNAYGETLRFQNGVLQEVILSNGTVIPAVAYNPAVSFDPARGFSSLTQISGIETFGNASYGKLLWQDGEFVKADLIDMNGDGILDRVIQQDGNRSYFDVQLGTGERFLSSIKWEGVQNLGNPANGFIRRVEGWGAVRLDLFDLNGDGLPDRVLAFPDQRRWSVQFNNGKGFDPFTDYGPIETPGFGYNPENGTFKEMAIYKGYIRYHGSPDWGCSSDCGGPQYDRAAVTLMADVNGDGLLDRVMQTQEADPLYVQLNTGKGFKTSQIWALNPEVYQYIVTNDWPRYFNTSQQALYIDMMDVTGDGRADRVMNPFGYLGRTSPNHFWIVQEGTDSGFLPAHSVEIASLGTESWTDALSQIPKMDLIDLNGDGLVDRIYQPDSGVAIVQMNLGGYFASPVTWTNAANLTFNPEPLRDWWIKDITKDFRDLDGDELPDRIIYDTANPNIWQIRANQLAPDPILYRAFQRTKQLEKTNFAVQRLLLPLSLDLSFLKPYSGVSSELAAYEAATGDWTVETNSFLSQESKTSSYVISQGKYSQSFQVAQKTGLKEIELMLRKERVPEGEIVVRIHSDQGGIPGDVLATSESIDLQFDAVSHLWNWTRFQFLDPVNLEAGKTYHFSIGGKQGSIINNQWEWLEVGVSSSNPYSGGNANRSEGDIWKNDLQGADLAFRLYETKGRAIEKGWHFGSELAKHRLHPEAIAMTELDEKGNLLTVTKANGTTTIYDNGRAVALLNEFGEMEIRYEYDSEGNPTRIRLEASRRRLPLEIERAKKQVETGRLEALFLLAHQRALAIRDIKGKVIGARNQLEQSLEALSKQRAFVESLSGKGKMVQQVKAQALSQIAGAVSQIETTFTDLFEKEAQALAQINTQVAQVKDQIEQESQKAFQNIENQRAGIERKIVDQETTPLIFHYYRKILGRDPTKKELDYWLSQANFVTGLNLPSFKTTLESGQVTFSDGVTHSYATELQARKDSVNAIKLKVESEILKFFTLTGLDRANFLASLGLTESDLGPLSLAEAQRILEWVKTRSLHFGQSAYRSLEALLEEARISYNREDLATKLILIDILAGVITPLDNKQYNPDADGELVLSLYAMKKVAKLYGLDTFAVKMSFEELLAHYQATCPDPSVACSFRAVVHIDGNHYVIVTKVTADSITYIDPGAGAEGTQELVTISQTEFLEVWQGVVLTPRAPPQTVQVLTETQQKEIRGAFFFLFIPLLIALAKALVAAITGIIGAIIAGIGQIIGGIISGIGSMLGGIFQGLGMIFTGNFLGGITTMFQGIVAGLGQILQGFVFAFNGIQGALFGGLLGVTDALPLIGGPLHAFFFTSGFQFIFQAGLLSLTAFGLSKGLEAIGLPPLAAGLISGFITGGIVSFNGALSAGFTLTQATNTALLGSLSNTALQGLGALGQVLDLPPLLTDGIQLVGQLAAGFAVGGAVGLGSWEALKQVAPKALGEFANVGVAILGEKLGLPVMLSSFLGSIARGGASAFSANFIASRAPPFNGGGGPGGIFGFITNALKGVTQAIGINFGGKISDPVFGSLLSRDVLSSIESSLGRSGLFSGILDLLKQSLLSPFNLVNGIVRQALDGITSFESQIQAKGLAGALESFAVSIFSRQTLEKILNLGGISGVLGSIPKILTTLVTGQQAQEIQITGSASIFFDTLGNFIGKKEGGITQIGTFGVDSFGKWALVAGKVFATILGDLVFAGDVENGSLKRMSVSSSDSIILEGDPTANGPIIIDGSDFSTTGFWSMIFKLVPLGISLFFKEGIANAAEIAVSPQTAATNSLIDLVLLNGFTPFGDLAPGTVPAYFDEGNPFRKKLNDIGVSDAAIKAIPIFKTGNDIINWLLDQEQSFEIRREFNRIRKAQPEKPFVPLAYSGAGRPLLDALSNQTQDGFGIRTAIMVGAPLLEQDTYIKSPSLERVINVYGSEDLVYLGQGASVPPIFTNRERSLETINIELSGIDHNEYFYANGEATTPEQVKASNFIARLTQAALNTSNLEDVLSRLVTPKEQTFIDPVTGLSHRIRTYVIDTKNLPDNF